MNVDQIRHTPVYTVTQEKNCLTVVDTTVGDSVATKNMTNMKVHLWFYAWVIVSQSIKEIV
jgi:hypothetical protein